MAAIPYRESLFGTKDVRLRGCYCGANCAIGKDYLTILLIHTPEKHRSKGEAQKLLSALKDYAREYEQAFRVRAPLTPPMIHICQKLKIETCDLEEVLKDGEKRRDPDTDKAS